MDKSLLKGKIMIEYHNHPKIYFTSIEKIGSLTNIPEYHYIKLLSCQKSGLRELPELPNSLEKLFCERNQLTSLPKLPKSLKSLRCEFNLLSKLPNLPEHLDEIICKKNHLLVFLPELPKSIEHLESDFTNTIKNYNYLDKIIFL